MYKTKRTCTVSCIRYNTLARIKYENFRDICINFRPLKNSIFKYSKYKYRDPTRLFLLENISQIYVFKDLKLEQKLELIYQMEIINYDKSITIVKEDDLTECMYIVADGII